MKSAEFSHEICPKGAEKLYPELYPYKKGTSSPIWIIVGWIDLENKTNNYYVVKEKRKE
jgi:hypothetical protein